MRRLLAAAALLVVGLVAVPAADAHDTKYCGHSHHLTWESLRWWKESLIYETIVDGQHAHAYAHFWGDSGVGPWHYSHTVIRQCPTHT